MNERQIYIDWIRIFLIFSVFLFHVGMVFNGWGWHIKNDVRVEALNPIMQVLHAWRMPLLFLVSGAGTRFALGIRSKWQFIAERTRRLFIPLLFGIFLLVPVQVYIEKIGQYPSLANFYLHMFDGVYPTGNFSWHHLWFIVYLFFISLIFLPMISFYRSKYYPAFEVGLERMVSGRGGLMLFYLPLIVSQVILRPYFPEETHGFADDWAYICLFSLYFLYGFILAGSQRMVGFMVRDCKIMLLTTIAAIVVMYSALGFTHNSRTGWMIYDILSLLMSWSVTLAVLGYFRKFLNSDHPWRRPLNEAIYPFYLLHQPVIIVVAYWVVHLSLPVGAKAFLIILIALSVIWLIYRFLIVPFKATRVIFGLKKDRRRVADQQPRMIIPTDAEQMVVS